MEVTNRDLGQIFKMPSKKHHTNMILLVVVILACVAILGWYFVGYKSTSTVPVVSDQPRVISEQEKLEILGKLSSGIHNNMPEKEKVKVVQSISSKASQAAAASLSEQDKRNILESLSR